MKRIKLHYLATGLFVVSSIGISVFHIRRGTHMQALLGPVSLLFLLIAPIAQKVLRVKFDEKIKGFIVLFAMFAFNVGTGLEWYEKFENYSFLVHGISGVLFTQIGFFLYFIITGRKETDLKKQCLLSLSYAFFFSMAIAVSWEISEYFTYLVTGRDVQHTLTTGVHDTMLDLISCTAGSLFMGIIYFIYVKWDKKTYFINMILEFYDKNRK